MVDMDYYYTESIQCQYTVNIESNKNLLYKILRNKKTMNITYVTTYMSFLYNIAQFNNTVVILYTVYIVH